MYDWRRMCPADRRAAVTVRRERRYPWHGPPHPVTAKGCFHVYAACYEHRSIMGSSPERITSFGAALLDAAGSCARQILAWCVLPNHYHLLAEMDGPLDTLTAGLGKLHGRSSYFWNAEDNARGRKVWHRCSDRAIRSSDISGQR